MSNSDLYLKVGTAGIEPAISFRPPVCKTGALPTELRALNLLQVGEVGFEPTPSRPQTERASQAAPHPDKTARCFF
jgi:hypothetical protein